LFVANHPSLIDVVALLGALPRCNCIVKKELFQHPFMGGVLRGTGLLPNDNGPALIESVNREFKKGRNLMIWPEGTRSPMGGLHPFQRGAARIVLHSRAAIVPVVITCDPPALMKGQRWYDVPHRAINLKLSFHRVMPLPAEVTQATSLPLAVRALNHHLESYFSRALEEPRSAAT